MHAQPYYTNFRWMTSFNFINLVISLKCSAWSGHIFPRSVSVIRYTRTKLVRARTARVITHNTLVKLIKARLPDPDLQCPPAKQAWALIFSSSSYQSSLIIHHFLNFGASLGPERNECCQQRRMLTYLKGRTCTKGKQTWRKTADQGKNGDWATTSRTERVKHPPIHCKVSWIFTLTRNKRQCLLWKVSKTRVPRWPSRKEKRISLLTEITFTSALPSRTILPSQARPRRS